MLSFLVSVIRNPKEWDPNFRVNDLMRFQKMLFKIGGMYHIPFENYLPRWLHPLSVALN